MVMEYSSTQRELGPGGRTGALERFERLRFGNEQTVQYFTRSVAPWGLRAFFLLVAYGICIVRGALYTIQEPFVRCRDDTYRC